MKVRVKELAQEAKFIRFEENKIKKKQKISPNYTQWDYVNKCYTNYPDVYSADFRKLKTHRRHEVREAARAAQLAYAFLRQVPYSKVEQKRKPEKEYRFQRYIKPEIVRLANKFGYRYQKETYADEIEKWLNEGLTT